MLKYSNQFKLPGNYFYSSILNPVFTNSSYPSFIYTLWGSQPEVHGYGTKTENRDENHTLDF